MTLARALPDDATEWWIFLGTVLLYALGRWFFAWQRARCEGDSHPVRTAFAEEDDPVVSHAVTEGRLRYALLWIIVPLLVIALSYLDFRQSLNERSGA